MFTNGLKDVLLSSLIVVKDIKDNCRIFKKPDVPRNEDKASDEVKLNSIKEISFCFTLETGGIFH